VIVNVNVGGGVRLGVGVGVLVGVGVSVGVSVGVAVGVAVPVEVGVAVAVNVGVAAGRLLRSKVMDAGSWLAVITSLRRSPSTSPRTIATGTPLVGQGPSVTPGNPQASGNLVIAPVSSPR
jgi:hypothetical protein